VTTPVNEERLLHEQPGVAHGGMAQAHTRSAHSDPRCDTPRASTSQAAKGAHGAQSLRASVRRQRHRCGGETTADGALGSWGQL